LLQPRFQFARFAVGLQDLIEKNRTIPFAVDPQDNLRPDW
jgi:hypothetical protein